VCRAYGVLYDKEVDGQKVKSIQRSTFIIDKQGKLRHALYGVHAHGHPQEVLALLKEMT
jgi:thioredoxin-dependent peroxiredoxin